MNRYAQQLDRRERKRRAEADVRDRIPLYRTVEEATPAERYSARREAEGDGSRYCEHCECRLTSIDPAPYCTSCDAALGVDGRFDVPGRNP